MKEVVEFIIRLGFISFGLVVAVIIIGAAINPLSRFVDRLSEVDGHSVVVRRYKRIMCRANIWKYLRGKYKVTNDTDGIILEVQDLPLKFSETFDGKENKPHTECYLKLPFYVYSSPSIQVELTDNRMSSKARNEFKQRMNIVLPHVVPNIIKLEVSGQLQKPEPPLRFTVKIPRIPYTETPLTISLRHNFYMDSIFNDNTESN